MLEESVLADVSYTPLARLSWFSCARNPIPLPFQTPATQATNSVALISVFTTRIFYFYWVDKIKCSYNSDSVELVKSSLKCLETKGKYCAVTSYKYREQPHSPEDECQLINSPAVLLHKSKIVQNISWLIGELLLHSIKLYFIFFFGFSFAWITTHVSNNFLLSFNIKECKLVCSSHPHIIKQSVDFSMDLYL